MKSGCIGEFRKIVIELEKAMDSQAIGCCPGVSRAECHALVAIEELGETTNARLSRELRLDVSTVSRTVDGLVRARLVNRLVHETDRRVNLLSLTEKGRETCDKFNEASEAYYEQVLQRLPEDLRDAAVEKFRLIAEAFVGHEKELRETGCCKCNGKASRGSKDARGGRNGPR